MPQPIETEDIATAIIDVLVDQHADNNTSGVTVRDSEPIEDIRSGGHFFEVEKDGQRFTVLVVEESR